MGASTLRPGDKRLHSVPPRIVWYGPAPSTVNWKGYVVPTKQLREVILSKKAELMPEALGPREGAQFGDDDFGWRANLASRVAMIMSRHERVTVEAVTRRIYSIMSGESSVAMADLADAICLAVGLFMDTDTNIQTFPGSITTAEEMVRERRPDLDKEATRRMAEKLMTYRNRVLFPDGYQPSPASVAARKARARRRAVKQQQALAA